MTFPPTPVPTPQLEKRSTATRVFDAVYVFLLAIPLFDVIRLALVILFEGIQTLYIRLAGFSFYTTSASLISQATSEGAAGKTAVVTGANTGIGLEIARGLAAAGFHVILACRTESRAADAISAIKATRPNAKLTFLQCDLASLLGSQVRRITQRSERSDPLAGQQCRNNFIRNASNS